MNVMQRILIIVGLACVATGLFLPYLTKLSLGKLPGDLFIEGGNFKFYLPIVTCILASVLGSLIVWFFRK